MAPSALPDEPAAVQGEKPTVYLLDTFHPAVLAYCQEKFHAILPGTPEHEGWREKARYLLIRGSKLTAEDVAACPKLVAIGKQGVGIDKIDAAACAARRIPIFNTPGVNARAVAELVLTLTTAVARDLGRIGRAQAAGRVVPKETCRGLILHEKTIGIVGMGNIGRTVARMFRGAYDARIVAYDPFLGADAWPDVPHTRAATVDDVLRAADVVTLHVPLTDQTRGLLSYPQFQLMKPTAMVINTARGGIVHEDDLARALQEGLLWGAGLDCHEQEPPSQERYQALWDAGVVSTPHIGAATEQTQIETGTAAAQKLYEFIVGGEQKAA